MISPKRMVEIFRRRGGGEFANLTEKLTADQIAYLEQMTEGEPVIALLSSESEWFALTKSHFVVNRARELRSVPFGDIYAVTISRRYPQDVRKFEHIKTRGGDLDVELQDGTTLQVTVEPGGPYLGLMNVLMRVAMINRRRKARGASDNPGRPTTNDERPTTAL